MKEIKPMPYHQALPHLLKSRGWSYRDLDHKTRKSASYWNQTTKSDAAAPKNAAAYERLADVFEVDPEFFKEYAPLKASELVLRDPKLAYMVVREAKRGEKK